MKYLIILWLIGFISIDVQAQDTLYLNKDWNVVEDRSQATYVRLMKRTSAGWYINDFYYPSGVLQMEGEVSSLSPPVLEGYCMHYYENGNKEHEGTYKSGSPRGVHKAYFPSGQMKSEIEYQSERLYYIQVWSESGEALLREGNGVYEEIDPEGNKLYHQIRDHEMILGYTVRTQMQDTVYSTPEVWPEYPGGYERFYRNIRKQLKYPKPARRAGIQGIVYVQFLIDKAGSVTEVKTVKGIGGGCDEESERVIRASKKWQPAQVSNQPVKSWLVLPITFKLN